MAEAIDAYAVPRRLFPPGRCEVRVDLGAGLVSVHVADGPVEESTADRILLAYVELICADSEASLAAPIPFTAMDLGVLRVVLASRRGEVTRYLEHIVGPLEEPTALPPIATRRTARNAALALAVVASTLAAVIAMQRADSSSPTPAEPIEVQIVDALVITR
jgi:hypothetical protein